MSMTDRRIGLDTAVTQGMPDFSQAGTGSGARRDADDADQRAFEQALAGRADAPADDADTPPALRPIDLYGSPPVPAAATPPTGLARSLEQAAGQLLVDDGSHGTRREVRITLKNDVLPGVTVAVYQDQGRVVASFACANETSRDKLTLCAQALADEMSRSLGQAALVRVGTDDPEDPCLFEAVATA